MMIEKVSIKQLKHQNHSLKAHLRLERMVMALQRIKYYRKLRTIKRVHCKLRLSN